MFYNVYPNRKDHRAPYYDTRRFDSSCKNHGSCDYCVSNRTFVNRRREPIVEVEFADLVPRAFGYAQS